MMLYIMCVYIYRCMYIYIMYNLMYIMCTYIYILISHCCMRSRFETEVQNSRPLRGKNNPFQTFSRAERLTSKPTVTSKQRRRQCLFNVQSNKRAGGGGGARTHNYFSSSPVTANTPQIDCFGGQKLYVPTSHSLARGLRALSYGSMHPCMWCGGRLYDK